MKTEIKFVFEGVVLADSLKVFPFLKIKRTLPPPLCITTKGYVEPIYTLRLFLLSQAMFENKNKISVWGVVLADSP